LQAQKHSVQTTVLQKTKNKKQKPQFPENTAEIKLVFHYTLAQRENRQIFLTDRIYVSTNNLMNYD
jgi:uncharacterized protein YccT (UPF0319 family)